MRRPAVRSRGMPENVLVGDGREDPGQPPLSTPLLPRIF